MIQTVFGTKQKQTQVFLEDGRRVPVTIVAVPSHTVLEVKNQGKDGYNAVRLALGEAKRANNSLKGLAKKAGLTTLPQFVREVRVLDEDVSEAPGQQVILTEALKPGDIVKVTGISKGKGFAGGVKRYHFRGGPKTHGQSDRHRAPGSIGQGTTPGRVYKGKRMAGRMGQDQVTIQNLQVIEVTTDSISLKGLVPGSLKSLISIKKTGESKSFTPVFKLQEEVLDEEARVTKEPQETSAEVKQVELTPKVEEKDIKEEKEDAK